MTSCIIYSRVDMHQEPGKTAKFTANKKGTHEGRSLREDHHMTTLYHLKANKAGSGRDPRKTQIILEIRREEPTSTTTPDRTR